MKHTGIKKEDELVTIICFTYNHEKYIKYALDGFLSQKTDFKFKIIIHDDASTDATGDLIEKYAEKYPEIIIPIIQKQNQRQSGIRGMALERKTIFPLLNSKYVAVCEGDDYWTDEYKLQYQIDFMEAHPAYVGTVHNSITLDMRKGTKEKYNKCWNSDRDVSLSDVISGNYGIYQTASLVCKTENYINPPDYFDLISVGDYPRALQLTTEGKVRYFAKIMSVYRYASGVNSWTNRYLANKYNFRNRCIRIYSEEKMLERLLDLNPKYIEQIIPTLIKKEYDYNYFSGNIKEIKRKNELLKIYSEESIIRKLKLHILSLVNRG